MVIGSINYHFGCHGIEERCFKVKGKSMHFCARCLGCAIGNPIGIASVILSPAWLSGLWIVGLLIMLLDWFMQNQLKLYKSNMSRLSTGILGSFSLVWLVWTAFNSIREQVLLFT
jgi:uncharacterized membrane protein